MQTQATKGIVLKTVQYGETSIIASIYTEVYGLQSYMIKGVRKPKKNQALNLYQPSAILNLNVTHNPFKNLQYIQSAEWSYLYSNSLFSVIKNAVSVYIIELLYNCIQQPEPNEDIFYLTETVLTNVDGGSSRYVANAPLYYCIHLISLLGVGFEGRWTEETKRLDLKEGKFLAEVTHDFVLSSDVSRQIFFAMKADPEDADKLELTTAERREVLTKLHAYLKFQFPDVGLLKSWKVLQAVL